MFSPVCICVCSFSTTSPSPIRSCVILMPVIAENAGARTVDSYVWVAMVSETTLISMPWNGCAASMNHCISASCSARDRADRSIVSSRNAVAASISAKTGVDTAVSSSAIAVLDFKEIVIISSLNWKYSFLFQAQRQAPPEPLRPFFPVRPSGTPQRHKRDRLSARKAGSHRSHQATPD